MTKLKKIKKIAGQVREAFEEIEKEEGNCSWSKTDALSGYCGRASTQLYLACRRAGIKIRMVEASGHMFNTYENHIVDVTATQFNDGIYKYPKVYDYIRQILEE